MEGEREKERTHVRAIAVILVVVFLSGVFLGYYVWGYRRQLHPDYKEMLKQTISYISTLEEKNQEMTAKIGTLENDVASLKKQMSAPVEDQQARISERLAALEKENADLKVAKSQQDALVQENQQLRQRVQSLVEELNASKGPKQAAPATPTGAAPPGASGY